MHMRCTDVCCAKCGLVPEAIVTTRHDEGAVSVEVNRCDWIRVCGQSLETFACTHADQVVRALACNS
jgi:hypothetical protein